MPTPKDWQRYVAGLEAIYKRIFQIRNGRPVNLRTYTRYLPAISHVRARSKTLAALGHAKAKPRREPRAPNA